MKSSRKRVLPLAGTSWRRRRVSVCPITRVVLPPAGCLVPRRSVEKTAGVPPDRSKLHSRLSREKTISPRPDADERDALLPILRRFGRGGTRQRQRTSDALCEPNLQHSSIGTCYLKLMTFCSESSLLLNASAARQCSGDQLQSTLHGRGATHKTICIIDASFPRVLTCRYSSSPAHGTGFQRVEKSHPRQNKQSVSPGRVGNFVSGLGRETIHFDGPFSFVGSGYVLSSQRVAGSPTARHCTTQSTHDETLVSAHFYQWDQRKVKARIAGHVCHSGFWTPSGCLTGRYSSRRWLQEHTTKHLGAYCIPVCTTR